MNRFVSHLESALDGTVLPADRVQTMHKDRPLWVRYDLDAIGRAVSPETLAAREPTMWRYRELLPLPFDEPPVTLGEGFSPLLPAPRLGEALGLKDLWIKDESQLPTGSFKCRGLGMAVSMARHFDLKRLALPTAGNAGGALAAYAARAGMEAFVFMPHDTPVINQMECAAAGAKVFRVKGLIPDCAAIVRGGIDRMEWFDCSTLKEPYRLEGKKTMGLELAEQFGWKLPDVILYPTGGGTGLIGMWKAFRELRALGWLRSENMPRMVAVQSDGCAPIPRAFERGERFAAFWDDARTCASGLRVPSAVGDFLILDAVRESGGCAVAVPEQRILETARNAARLEGVPLCPEAATGVLAIERMLADGRLRPDERVVLFNTGSANKYVEAFTPDLPLIEHPKSVSYDALA